MKYANPIIVVYPIDSDIRIVQIAPGADPSAEPLLLHVGLICDLGDKVYVAPDGVKGTSPHTRQFLTMVNNDLTEPMLTYLVEELNCPIYRSQTPPELRARMEQIRRDTDDMHDIDQPPLDDPSLDGPM